MLTYPRPTPRSSRGLMSRNPVTFAFIVMLLLGSLASPMVLSVTAADMPSGQQAADLAKQPVQPTSPESTTEPARAAANAQASPMATPNVETTSVSIYTRECVSGTLTGQLMSYYQGEDQCEGEKPGVVFTVTDDTGTQQISSDEDGRQIDGLVGEVTITEILPADYETPAAFCTSLTSQPGQEITGSGNSVTLPSGTDADYQCSFYNIPSGVSATGTGDVLVYTYSCATTPPPNSTYAWYFQNCRTRQNGATFVLDTPDGDIKTTAGDSLDGAVTMRGLEVGENTLTETVTMPNYETGAVFCAEIGKAELPGPAQMMPPQLSGNSISAPVTTDTLFYCEWYHVPTSSVSTPAQ